MQPLAISIQGLVKSYKQNLVLNGFTVNVSKGETLALWGPNGSGKSTLFKILAMMTKPDHGYFSVHTDKWITAESEIKRSIGFSFQDISLDLRMTVEQNLTLAGALHGISSREATSRINTFLEQFQLSKFKQTLICKLSGGQKKLVDIIRALLPDPPIYFFDEPTAHLDQNHRDLWFSLLSALTKSNKTIILSTHDIGEAMVCQKVAFLYSGRIAVQDSPQNLLKRISSLILELPHCIREKETWTNYFGIPICKNDRLIYQVSSSTDTFNKFQNDESMRPTFLAFREANLHDAYLFMTKDLT